MTSRRLQPLFLSRGTRAVLLAGTVFIAVVGCTTSETATPPSTTTASKGPKGTDQSPTDSPFVGSATFITEQLLERLVDFDRADAELINQLEAEALFATMSSASGGASYKSELLAQRPAVDTAIKTYQTASDAIPIGSDAFSNAAKQVQNRLGQLPTIRSGVDSQQIDALAVSDQFENIVGDLVSQSRSMLTGIDDPEIFRGLWTFTNLLAITAAEGHTATLLSISTVVGFYASELPGGSVKAASNPAAPAGCDPDPSRAGDRCKTYDLALKAQDAIRGAENDFDRVASGPQRQIKRSADAGVKLDGLKKAAFDDGLSKNDLTGAKGGIKVDPVDFQAAVQDRITKLAGAQARMLTETTEARRNNAPTDSAQSADALAQILDFDRANANLVFRLEVEGLSSAAFAASGGTTNVTELKAARGETDSARLLYDTSRDAVTVDNIQFAEAKKQADNRLKQLNTIRISVDGVQSDALGLNDQYTAAVDDLLAQSRALALGVNDPRVFRPLWTHSSLLDIGAADAKTAALLDVSVVVGFYAAQLPGGSVKEASNPPAGLDGPGAATCNPDPKAARRQCKTYQLALEANEAFAQLDARFDETATADQKQIKRDADAGSKLSELQRIAFEDGIAKNDLTGTKGGTKVDPSGYLTAAVERFAALNQAQAKLLDLIKA